MRADAFPTAPWALAPVAAWLAAAAGWLAWDGAAAAAAILAGGGLASLLASSVLIARRRPASAAVIGGPAGELERRLRDSESFKAAIVDNALGAVVSVDGAGRIVEFNPVAERTFGYRRADVIGRPMEELIVPPHLREAHRRGFARCLASGEGALLGRRVEISALHADGREFPVELAITATRLAGQPAFTAFIIDISDRKRTEAELARQREALHQSEKLTALGSLLAGVAHELNNPLSIVVGRSSMLLESVREPAVRQQAEKIRVAAERCARIVRTFLAMARRRPPERVAADLNEIVRGALDLVGYGLRADGIAVACRLDGALPPLAGDPDQLSQVVTNLVVNAQQALRQRRDGRILAVTTRVVPGEAAVELAVADNGPGVPAANRSRIFEPFFTTKPTGHGTGVGLSVCLGIVRAHGGRIDLADTEGGGATFVVRLSTGAPAEAAPLRPATGSGGGARVLVVDDEAEVAEMLTDIFAAHGWRAEMAGSGSEALRRLQERDYDLIVSDVRMPDLDGPGLWRELQAVRPELLARLVFATGDTLGVNIAEFLAQSGCPVLEKPFQPEDVLRVAGERLAAAGRGK